jgi:bifunctional DNA-binding transcriptional regulator/antitoxin component of YhaV-PrlF toxin-antitoxin module
LQSIWASAGLQFATEHVRITSVVATFTIDDTGQIILPDAMKRVFGVEPGVRLRAEVTSDRIEIVKDIPVVTETTRSSSGRLIYAATGIQVDSGKAIREERDELANRAVRK